MRYIPLFQCSQGCLLCPSGLFRSPDKSLTLYQANALKLSTKLCRHRPAGMVPGSQHRAEFPLQSAHAQAGALYLVLSPCAARNKCWKVLLFHCQHSDLSNGFPVQMGQRKLSKVYSKRKQPPPGNAVGQLSTMKTRRQKGFRGLEDSGRTKDADLHPGMTHLLSMRGDDIRFAER